VLTLPAGRTHWWWYRSVVVKTAWSAIATVITVLPVLCRQVHGTLKKLTRFLIQHYQAAAADQTLTHYTSVNFLPVRAVEITHLQSRMPTVRSTRIIKRCSRTLILSKLFNVSLQTGELPDIPNHAIVFPWWRQSTLDADDKKSYRTSISFQSENQDPIWPVRLRIFWTCCLERHAIVLSPSKTLVISSGSQRHIYSNCIWLCKCLLNFL
jgi:hypothetical protein